MNRLFGTSAPKPPKATLNSAISNLDGRLSALDVKLAALNAELSGYQAKLAKMREGPGKQALKQKALGVLRRRKQYEAQREQVQAQAWNMEQAQMMQSDLKNTMLTVGALQQTAEELRKEYGKFDVDKVVELQDRLADFEWKGKDIQEALAQSYCTPSDVDEDELDRELEGFGGDADAFANGQEDIPCYLEDEVPKFIEDKAPAPNRGEVGAVASG